MVIVHSYVSLPEGNSDSLMSNQHNMVNREKLNLPAGNLIKRSET